MAIIRRGKIQTIGSSNTNFKSKVVYVVGEDSEENLVNTIDISLPTIEGQPIPSSNNITLPLKVVKANGNKRFVFKELTFSENPVNLPYNVIGTMKDANNVQIGEPLEITIEVEEDGDSRVRNLTITELSSGEFRLKIVIVGDSENNVASVDVVFSDYSGPEPIPAEISLTNPIIKNEKKIFKDKTLTFDDPSGAIDEIYYLVVDLKNTEGNSIGSTEYTVAIAGSE